VLTSQGSPIPEFGVNGEGFTSLGGRFEVTDKGEGLRHLCIRAKGFAPTVRAIHIERGETVEVPDILLRPERMQTVSVVDARNQQPVLGAWVAYQSFENRCRVEGKSLGDGRYALSAPDGDSDARLFVWAPGFAPANFEVSLDSLAVSVVLAQGGRIVGRVLDEGGSPARNVTVRAKNSVGGSWGHSRPDGSFEIRNLPPGRYSVQVDGSRYLPREVEVVADTDVQVTLTPRGPETAQNDPRE
jgi:hypothetical protein